MKFGTNCIYEYVSRSLYNIVTQDALIPVILTVLLQTGGKAIILTIVE